jgi:ribose-phosphate pyrophosphokinase
MSRHLKLFSGTANQQLASAIAGYLGTQMSVIDISRFRDGETKVSLETNVRGADVFIIQPTCPPVNDNLMELLLILDALKRASAGRITAVVPYYGYGRQDRKIEARAPITAKLVADLISAAGPHRVLTLDLHAGQIQGFFNTPVDNLKADPVIVNYLREKKEIFNSLVVVAPDEGSAKRARRMAELMGCHKMAMIDRRDFEDKDSVIGDVADHAVIVDDMIDTGDTVCKAAEILVRHGVKKVYAAVTHGVLSGNAIERINDSPLIEVILTDSIPIQNMPKFSPKITVLSVAHLMGEAIRRIHNEESVSSLFQFS